LLNLDQIEKETGYLGEREWVDPANTSNSTHAFTTDHVLYSKLRPNLNKVACPDEPGICTTELIRLRPDPHRLRRKFLTYFLRSEYYMGFARQVVAGAKMPRMVMDRFWEFEIPLPPLPEQDRIVEILDQADALRQQRRQADTLSQRILPALFHEMFGDPLARDSKWKKKPLGSMGTLDRGVSKKRPRNSPDLLGGPYPLIQTGDIANASGVIKTYSSSYSEAGLAQSKLWPAGTLCITIAANIGKTAILDFEACFPDSVVGFIPNEETNVEYVQCLFHFFQPILEMNAPQAAQKNINLKTLRELEAPAPPYALQEKFGESVRLFRDSSVKQTTSAATLETLFQTLLHRAFDGSLTAKWREGQTKEVLQEMERNANKLA
jgi:type I restriction enzyme S subunit